MFAQSQSQTQTHLGGSEGRGVQGVVGEDRGGGEQLAQRLPLPIDGMATETRGNKLSGRKDVMWRGERVGVEARACKGVRHLVVREERREREGAGDAHHGHRELPGGHGHHQMPRAAQRAAVRLRCDAKHTTTMLQRCAAGRGKITRDEYCR